MVVHLRASGLRGTDRRPHITGIKSQTISYTQSSQTNLPAVSIGFPKYAVVDESGRSYSYCQGQQGLVVGLLLQFETGAIAKFEIIDGCPFSIEYLFPGDPVKSHNIALSATVGLQGCPDGPAEA